jgi:tetratricopeptide (TPR) repeat protein
VKSPELFCACVLGSVWLCSCGPSPETTKRTPSPAIETKELLYQRGHQLYAEQQFDSAETILKAAVALDPYYRQPLNDLAEMHYALGMRESGEGNPRKREQLRLAREYFARMESLGASDGDLYERLCELSNALKDEKTFLKYAKKYADLYPFDRQYLNLGIAYFEVADYAGVIRTQKTALEKFKSSPFVGSFYRQLGRAYMKVDRDQTAEKTFTGGIQAVDSRLAELRKSGGDYKSTDAYRRLVEDKVSMLLLLKRLHQTYKETDKLESVERQLKEAGSAK